MNKTESELVDAACMNRDVDAAVRVCFLRGKTDWQTIRRTVNQYCGPFADEHIENAIAAIGAK